MKKIIKFSVIFISFMFLAITLIFYWFDLVLNTTKSMPIGIYQKTNGDLYVNDIVLVKNHIKNKNLIKKIKAKQGDFVVINKNGVYVNKVKQTNSNISKLDSNGQKLTPHYISKILKKDEFLVLGEHQKSFDSRYFGLVYNDELEKLKEIFTFNIK